MKKKLISIMLTIVCVVALAGCGNKEAKATPELGKYTVPDDTEWVVSYAGEKEQKPELSDGAPDLSGYEEDKAFNPNLNMAQNSLAGVTYFEEPIVITNNWGTGATFYISEVGNQSLYGIAYIPAGGTQVSSFPVLNGATYFDILIAFDNGAEQFFDNINFSDMSCSGMEMYLSYENDAEHPCICFS